MRVFFVSKDKYDYSMKYGKSYYSSIDHVNQFFLTIPLERYKYLFYIVSGVNEDIFTIKKYL